jgi:hypothetical protein
MFLFAKDIGSARPVIPVATGVLNYRLYLQDDLVPVKSAAPSVTLQGCILLLSLVHYRVVGFTTTLTVNDDPVHVPDFGQLYKLP